ncbi:MAG TPA: tRNA(Met) cytidine acetyltransferase [Candidatus Tenderia electrophaga]|uniref:tRNA(Met) cytidine acetyltransferase TmcA n=1 Tax=Candidatus Tenderia electrophaga TaxID=1748243 RepID=A0A832N3R0_9GAMM|nr:tRNA(Met) cytidine acetyltransferase [Candidatus Tenderia electrophaga]
MSDSASQSEAIIDLALKLGNRARHLYQRRGLVISGNQEWCAGIALKIAALFDQPQVWVTRQPPTGVESYVGREVLQRLGSEVALLVFDCHAGFDVDAFGAASGLINGGGLLLLLTPPLDHWPQQADPEAERFFKHDGLSSHFIRRFIRIAKDSTALVLVAENSALPHLVETDELRVVTSEPDGPCRTLDQQAAVAAIVALAKGRSQPSMVLLSDRGRGKSSALGIAAAQLLRAGCCSILVTAPRLAAVNALFDHARRLLPQASVSAGLLSYGDAHLRFIAPDELLEVAPEADLLLVDEAAAIPTPMLEKMLSYYPRRVFATTVHGYEGTGRGFALRFNKVLDRQSSGWQQWLLRQPIRWAENDGLEQFVFDALLLNASIAAQDELTGLDLPQCQIDLVSGAELMCNQGLLTEVFGLLVLAHYRTRPNDLRQLLDSPELKLYVMSYHGHVVAVVLLGFEGGLDETLAKRIYQGRRRPQGHLIPQSLATHAGLVEAPTLRYLRVMRIAVHPLVQGQGLGTALLRHVAASVTEEDCDCLGASFGLTQELLRFWQGLGFVAVRLGLSREHSSGSHSLIMLRPVSAAGESLLQKSHQRMQRQLPALLAGPLNGFDAQLADALMSDACAIDGVMTALDWQDVISFAYGLRGYEFCMAAIILFIKTLPQALPELTARQSQLLSIKVADYRDWSVAVKIVGLSGRAEAIKQLREILRLLLEHYADQAVLENVRASLDL